MNFDILSKDEFYEKMTRYYFGIQKPNEELSDILAKASNYMLLDAYNNFNLSIRMFVSTRSSLGIELKKRGLI